MKEYAKLGRANPYRVYAEAHKVTKGCTEEEIAALKAGDIVEVVCQIGGSDLVAGDLFEVVEVTKVKSAPVKNAPIPTSKLPKDKSGDPIRPKGPIPKFVDGESYPIVRVKRGKKTYTLDETMIVVKKKA